MNKKLPLELTYPVILVMLLDALFTLLGQPTSYWSDFTAVMESSPVGFYSLRIHPLLFILMFLLYLGLSFSLLRRLPLRLSMILALSLFLGHTYGSSTWIPIFINRLELPKISFIDWYLLVGYVIIISIISTFFIYKYIRKK